MKIKSIILTMMAALVLTSCSESPFSGVISAQKKRWDYIKNTPDEEKVSGMNNRWGNGDKNDYRLRLEEYEEEIVKAAEDVDGKVLNLSLNGAVEVSEPVVITYVRCDGRVDIEARFDIEGKGRFVKDYEFSPFTDYEGDYNLRRAIGLYVDDEEHGNKYRIATLYGADLPVKYENGKYIIEKGTEFPIEAHLGINGRNGDLYDGNFYLLLEDAEGNPQL